MTRSYLQQAKVSGTPNPIGTNGLWDSFDPRFAQGEVLLHPLTELHLIHYKQPNWRSMKWNQID